MRLRLVARENYRREISRSGTQWQFALANCFCGIAERFVNVLGLQIRVRRQNLLTSHAIRDHAYHGRDGNPQATKAGHPTHLTRVYGDAIDFFTTSLATIIISAEASNQ